MDSNWEKDYPSPQEISEESLDENSSLKKMLRLVGLNKRVIDFGCATGYFAKLLVNNGCQVTGVEVNSDAGKIAEKYCEQVVIGDLDFVSLGEILPHQAFDVAVFGDVLEHLRNPWKLLEEVQKLLKPEGYVVASIPNIAHGAIRLALLQGRFEYMKLGILDDTHLRFFTRQSVEELFERSGYFVDVIDRTKLPVISDSPLVPAIDKYKVNDEILKQLQQEEEAETFQFILRAYPLSLTGKYAALKEKYCPLMNESQQSQVQLQQTQGELADSQAQLQQTQGELVNSQAQLQQTQGELVNSQAQLQQTQGELVNSQAQLQQTQGELANSQAQLQQTQGELAHSQMWITAIESSKFWKLRTAWFQLRRVFGLPEDVSLQPRQLFSRGKYLFAVLRVRGLRYSLAKFLNKTSQKLDAPKLPLERLPEIPRSDDANYQNWLDKNYPKESDLQKMAQTAEIFTYKPLISIIMPVFNPPEHFLREAIESVLNQVYPYWELCIADDASTKPYVRSVLEEYASRDARIKVVFRTENGHISLASNSAIEVATGEFIALLDHDDLLTPDALYEAALLLNRHSNADMIYSDEDKVDENNRLRDPFFKPDWCPDSFLSRMYTCHLGIYRQSLVNQIGGFRVGYEGSQDYDFVLRLTEKTENIFHIPKVLYHWRIHPASTAASLNSKSYTIDAAQKAIAEALERRGEPGIVVPAPGVTGYYVVRYQISTSDLVSIIIPTKNLGNVLDKCLFSIFEKTSYPNYEIILIDNGSTEKETIEIINKWKTKEPNRFKCYSLDINFNYSKLNNFAVKQAKGKYLLFLNNDTEVITPDWIEAMVEQAQRNSIGAVGVLLLYPDDTIQHAGVVAGVGGVAGHSHKYFKANSQGYFSQINTVNNFSAVTAACLMCRRDVFEEVGGFEEDLAVAFNDVDFCFKLLEKGYRNIYLPHVVLYHYESKSRGSDDTAGKLARFIKEIEYMQNKWKKIIASDPCYNHHLTLEHEDYSIKTK